MTWIPDASALATFRENPELFRLRYRQHLVPPNVEEAPHAGSAAHAAINVWFDSETSDAEAAHATLVTAWGPEPDPLTAGPQKRPLALFERLLAAYCERWPRERDPFTVVANEEYVESDILIGADGGVLDVATASRQEHVEALTHIRWCGIVDRLIEFEDGSRYVMDLKTTGAWLGQDYFAPFALGPQMIGYVALERASGRRCDGFYIDAIHVDTRYGNVKPERDFERFGPVRVEDWRVARWARDVEWTLSEIKRLEAERGIDEPWPLYANFLYGKIGTYRDFFEQPAELHEATALAYVREAWEPKRISQERLAATKGVTA